MSFILDALRKSEHERQRQTGPALVEVAVAAPKSRTNVWATAAIGLLVVNLVAIGLLLLVKARDEQPAAAVGESAPTEARKPAAAPPAALAQPQSQPQTQAAAPAAQASITQALPPPSATRAPPPPMLQPAAGPPPPASRNPLAAEVSAGAGPVDGEVAARAATPPAGPPAVMAAPTQPGSVVYQSLPEAGPVAGSVPTGSRPAANLPTADELAASGGLPDMRLELHVYSNRPQERFVFVNGRRYREGDTTQEGASVEEITRDGVVMSLRGSRFLLPRD